MKTRNDRTLGQVLYGSIRASERKMLGIASGLPEWSELCPESQEAYEVNAQAVAQAVEGTPNDMEQKAKICAEEIFRSMVCRERPECHQEAQVDRVTH